MDLQLKGKKALVTGGTRGIGRAIVETLAREGCDVALCARDSGQVENTVKALGKHGGKATGQAIDVSDATALADWINQAAAELGGLDIVVANVSALAQDNKPETWRASFEIDIMGTVNTVESALPHVLKSKAGSLVAISSTAGVSANGPVRAYNPIKSAIITYMALQATNLAAKNVRANTVSPGMIYFEDGVWGKREREQPEIFKRSLAMNPMGRMGTPQEVANAVAFVASPCASFVTGANIMVDGALTRRVQF